MSFRRGTGKRTVFYLSNILVGYATIPCSARSDMFVEVEQRKISLQRSDTIFRSQGSGFIRNLEFYKHVAPSGARISPGNRGRHDPPAGSRLLKSRALRSRT